MAELIENVIEPSGHKKMKVLHGVDEELKLWRYVPAYMLKDEWLWKRICVDEQVDAALGVVTTTIRYPLLERVRFGFPKGWRSLFVVHREIGVTALACVNLAVDGLRMMDGVEGGQLVGFIKRLPKGAVDGVEVGGVCLMLADWMLEDCVAVGRFGAHPPVA